MPFLRISNARVQNTAFIDATVMMTAWFLATIIYTPILVVGFSAVPSNYYIKSKVPEDVVQYQLDEFQQGNIEKAFKYNSIDNQRVTGPWQSFAASLADQPFRPILCHTKATVLMTVSHNQNTDDEYVCCLVKVVPQNNQPLPKSLLNVIENAKSDDEEEQDDEEENDEDDEEIYNLKSTGSDGTQNEERPYMLYWWEVSKQFNNKMTDGGNGDDYYYLVDSILPDAEDFELDFNMETTLFAIDDEDDEFDDDDEDPDDGLGFYLDWEL